MNIFTYDNVARGRILALLIAFSLIFSVLPAHIFVAQATTLDDISTEITGLLTVAAGLDATQRSAVVDRWRDAVTTLESENNAAEIKTKILELIGFLQSSFVSEAQVLEIATAGLALLPPDGTGNSDEEYLRDVLEGFVAASGVPGGIDMSLAMLFASVSSTDAEVIKDFVFSFLALADYSNSEVVSLVGNMIALFTANQIGIMVIIASLPQAQQDDILSILELLRGLYLSDIGNRVWIDTNNNGLLEDGTNGSVDLGESGIDGVTLELLGSDSNPILDTSNNPITTITYTGLINGKAGYYHFYGLEPGDYKVRVVPSAGYAISSKVGSLADDNNSDADPITGETVVVAVDYVQSLNMVDMGLYAAYTIEGYVWHDDNGNEVWDGLIAEDPTEDPQAGWTVWITNGTTNASTTTGAGGYYSFEVPAGTWTITEDVQSGWGQTFPVSGSHVVTVPESGSTAQNEQTNFFAVVMNYLVPTAHAYSYYQTVFGDYNFGNNEIEGSRSSGTRISRGPVGQVLGASTSCNMYLYDYLRLGADNDTFEVQKLQIFLIGQGNYLLPITGVFDDATDTAVRAFQLKYASDILTPWFDLGLMSHQNPTGYVYKTTRWKINELVCSGSEALPNLLGE